MRGKSLSLVAVAVLAASDAVVTHGAFTGPSLWMPLHRVPHPCTPTRRVVADGAIIRA